jgi:putative acetyltransferase
MSEVTIRQEAAADREVVHAINAAAFEQEAEADLVERLRGKAEPCISLVAEIDGQIVGHILFTGVSITSEIGVYRAMGLAPMAVEPSHQRHGVGSALVARGLEACREAGHEIVLVLGHPEYYPRFGFERASTHGIRWEIEVPDEAFMVMELVPGALEGRAGVVQYHAEFGEL